MKKFFLILFLSAACIVVRAQDTTRLSMLFLGDIMQHDSQIEDAYDEETGSYDYRPCFQYIKPYIQAVDLAIGNLEVTLAGEPYKGYPQFSAPDELLIALEDVGMDVIVTANNHSLDRRRAGLERTITMLDAGHHARVDVADPVGLPVVEKISPAEIQQRLAWRVPRLEFTRTPLAEAIAMINRQGTLRLALADPALGEVRISGLLRVDNVESLLRLLELEHGIQAERRADGDVVLRSGR